MSKALNEPVKETLKVAGYRVTQVDVRQAEALDQIKFTYDDGSIARHGNDVSGESATPLILASGEFIVRVTHERMLGNRHAGAGLEVETSRRRVVSFQPRLASKWKSEQATAVADPGHELVGLTLRYGQLVGATQQPSPSPWAELPPRRPWFAMVVVRTPPQPGSPAHSASAAGGGGAAATAAAPLTESCQHFDSKSAALAALRSSVAEGASAAAAVVVDCMNRSEERSVVCAATTAHASSSAAASAAASAGGDDTMLLEAARAAATRRGLLAPPPRSGGGGGNGGGLTMRRTASALWALCSSRGDTAFMLFITALRVGSVHLAVRAQLLMGHVMEASAQAISAAAAAAASPGAAAAAAADAVTNRTAAAVTTGVAAVAAEALFSLQSANVTTATAAATTAVASAGSGWLPGNATQLLCRWAVDCSSSGDGSWAGSAELWRLSLVVSLLATHLLAVLLDQANVYFHHMQCDRNKMAMRSRVLRHVLRQEQAFFDTRSTAEVRANMDVSELNNLMTWTFPYILSTAVKLLLIALSLLAIHPGIATATLLATAAVRFGPLRRIDSLRSGAHRISRKLEKRGQLQLEDALSAVATVKTFGKERFHTRQFDASAAASGRFLGTVVRLRCYGELVDKLYRVAILVGVLWWAPYLFAGTGSGSSGSGGNGRAVSAGDITGFFLLLRQFVDSLGILKWMVEHARDKLPQVQQFVALMQRQPRMAVGGSAQPAVDGDIEFRDVWFQYPSRPDQPVLRGLNLTIAAGKVTAIVGDSGAGKSTLVKLLLRLYDPNRGSVLLGGRDLRECDTAQLRNRIAVVSQSPQLFDVTLADNVGYGAVGNGDGNDDADGYNMADVERACDMAQCGDFVQRFRTGLHTFAGHGGGGLSGGQRQRVAIARAALRNPAILVLDEATSALDAVNEARVAAALRTLMAGRTTTLIIAHRLSTVKSADDIICMAADGTVAERGTHTQLMAAAGLYANLVRAQLVCDDEASGAAAAAAAAAAGPLAAGAAAGST